uniref:Uncharacterized protein n=1 Tax=Ditylenchus dipsaci TaxID=166011 RepID=A0A915E8V4_9BILA
MFGVPKFPLVGNVQFQLQFDPQLTPIGVPLENLLIKWEQILVGFFEAVYIPINLLQSTLGHFPGDGGIEPVIGIDKGLRF